MSDEMNYIQAQRLKEEEMPIIGEIRKGREIGKKSSTNNFIWIACKECAKERWVKAVRGIPVSIICYHCAHSTKFQAENNPNWKGGRFITGQGYIKVLMPDHPKAGKDGYILEHVYIWEEYHQRQLPKDQVIHHLNGIKGDNRPENLIALKKGEHIHLAEPFKKRIRALEIRVRLLEQALEANQKIFRIEEN